MNKEKEVDIYNPITKNWYKIKEYKRIKGDGHLKNWKIKKPKKIK